MASFVRPFAVGLTVMALTGCVQDPKVENDVPPTPGAYQPAVSGTATVASDEACQTLLDAETAARKKLHCDPPVGSCPGRIAVGGSLPCDAYFESTVNDCAEDIGKYGACSDFDTRPCVVTPDSTTCHAQSTGTDSGAGDAGDAAAPPVDATVGDATSPVQDGSVVGPEAGPPPDASPAMDAAPPVDAGPG